MPINIVPKFLQKAFASSGAKADIPVDADLLNGRAGYNEGFPPVNMTPVAAGGIPPYGQDMNGVLYDLSAAIQYLQSGVNFPFDATFATAVGGYAAGAIVSDASDKTLLWVNGAANNTAFPSGWTSFTYSDPTETVRGLPLLATTAEVQTGTNASKVVTPSTLKQLTATETRAGLLELATAEEVEAFANAALAVTPAGLKSAFSGSRLVVSGNSIIERMPGGLIRMFGYTNTPGSVPFPVSFPSGLKNIVISTLNVANEDATAVITGTSSSSFTWQGRVAGAIPTVGDVGIFWMATGT